MLKKVNKDSRIVTKWSPIIENNFNYKNDSLKTLICFYCEWYSINEKADELPSKLMDINDKVNSFERVKIIGKFYNPASGIIEYKLDNGSYIPIKGKIKTELTDDSLVEIFGIEFVKNLDPEKFRNNQLNKLI